MDPACFRQLASGEPETLYHFLYLCPFSVDFWRDFEAFSGAPNGSVPQNICSSGTFLLAGRCGRNNSPWKESVAGKKIIQGVRGDLV